MRDSEPSFCDSLSWHPRTLTIEKTFDSYDTWRLQLLESLHNFDVVLPCVDGNDGGHYTPLYLAFTFHQSQVCFAKKLLGYFLSPNQLLMYSANAEDSENADR